MQITPASNNQLKLWKKLQMTKYRKKEGLFIAEGERCAGQILGGGFIEVEAVLVEEGFEPVSDILKTDVRIVSANRDNFRSISDTETPQGILAICKIPKEMNSDKLQDKKGIIIAMDAVQDPGNVGTIIRTASWFGAAGILFGEGTADPFHPKVVRSTAGATGALPYQKRTLQNLLSGFEFAGWKTYLMDGSQDAEVIDKIKPTEKSILVIGNEGNGISNHLFIPERKIVRIPGDNQTVESLNAAIALGIGLYHFKV